MHFIEVWPSSPSYHGHEPLTYHSEEPLPIGALVIVSIGRNKHPGFVVRTVLKPSFKTKAISEVLPITLEKRVVQLAEWMRSYYAAPYGLVGALFAPRFLLIEQKKPISLTPPTATTPPPLTQQQATAVTSILTQPQNALLLGITGSGKSRVYVELIQKQLEQNKSAIILVPEIGLSTQLSQYIASHVTAPVLVYHSTMTAKQRREYFHYIAARSQTEPVVIIGPRSALFTPLHNLGLIVIDEAHETAYKQDSTPHYFAHRFAAQLAHVYSVKVVTGTATPLVAEYYYALNNKINIVELTSQAIENTHSVKYQLVDLKDRSLFPTNPYLSLPLVTALKQALERGEQSLVFLNRRGTARVTLCSQCGWQALCPRCDLPLTFHADDYRLICHTCGFTNQPPTACPDCGNTDIRYQSVGTKAIVELLKHLLPEAQISRFDTDNKKSESLSEQYAEIKKGAYDIIVGTQMLAKGLDLPQLSVVGVLNAESALSIPDFSATERSFQLLYQVLGRVGRGHLSGHVIIQTFHPNSPVIKAAVKRDWKSFYHTEISEREKALLPPFVFLLKIVVSRKTETGAENAAIAIYNTLIEAGQRVQLLGPSPAFKAKSGGQYHFQIIAKSKQRKALLALIALLPQTVSYDIDPLDLL